MTLSELVRRGSLTGAVLLMALAAPAAAAEPAAVVVAQVQREDGSPLAEAWVWVAWDRGVPFRYADGTRRVLNPRARTLPDGRLRLEIPAGFFDRGEVLALAWEQEQDGQSRFTALHRADGGQRLRFSMGALAGAAGGGKKKKKGPVEPYDLGRLIAPSPEPAR